MLRQMATLTSKRAIVEAKAALTGMEGHALDVIDVQKLLMHKDDTVVEAAVRDHLAIGRSS